jgi:hypothetical protein
LLPSSAPRRVLSSHCVTAVLFCRCHGGPVRPCVSPAAAAARSSARDRTARSASGPLGVRIRPRRRLPDAACAFGTRGLWSDWPPAAPAWNTPTSGLRQKSPSQIPGWREGSCGPRGGAHHHPPHLPGICTDASSKREAGPTDSVHGVAGGGIPSAPRMERRFLQSLRVPSVLIGAGVSGTRKARRPRTRGARQKQFT